MSIYYVAGIPYSNELYHWGIKGQKWGIRRYQNPDGSLTAEGKARYGSDVERMAAKDAQRYSDAKAAYGPGSRTRIKLLDKELNEKRKSKEYNKAYSEAEKTVDVRKSLKRAERLRKNQGHFNKGKYLSDKGKTSSKILVNSLLQASGSILLSELSARTFVGDSSSIFANIIRICGAINAASIMGKGAFDAYDVGYYERNKKF